MKNRILLSLALVVTLIFQGCEKTDNQFSMINTTWEGALGISWPTNLEFHVGNILVAEIKIEEEIYRETGTYTTSYDNDSQYPHVIFDLNTHFGGIDNQGNKLEYYTFHGDMQVVRNSTNTTLDGTDDVSAAYKNFFGEIQPFRAWTTYYTTFKLISKSTTF